MRNELEGFFKAFTSIKVEFTSFFLGGGEKRGVGVSFFYFSFFFFMRYGKEYNKLSLDIAFSRILKSS